MKVLMKPIEMIAWFNGEKFPVPLRFRLQAEDGSNLVIKIDRILFQEEEKLAGNRMVVYRCEGVVQNLEKVFELKYEILTCKWFLFKM
ncbi:hypothetical protein [Gudongella sp. DL1XJH-153]|uniref:hypothetical protein n=1 Tax=Gudongella sp. DL1XJH-153 TaxID=3409804 RepID=UPI003BB79319